MGDVEYGSGREDCTSRRGARVREEGYRVIGKRSLIRRDELLREEGSRYQ